MIQMDDSQPGPPQEADVTRRDMEFVRRGQERWKDGYRVRMSEEQPERPTGRKVRGEDVMKVDQHASLAHLAEERCPGHITVERKSFQTVRPIQMEPKPPARERERWMAGFLHADALVVKHGRNRCSSDPTHQKKAPKDVATTVEMFPDAVLTPDEVKARKAAARKTVRGDAGEQT